MRPPTIDCHVHVRAGTDLPVLARVGRESGLQAMAIASTPDPERVNTNPLAFLAKKSHPGFFYLFAALDHSAHFSGGSLVSPSPGAQTDLLAELGADGIKLLETKPTSRKIMDVPADGDYFSGVFKRAEKRGLPLLWHVADPGEFWIPRLTPEWARRRGWGYDRSHVSPRQLYAEVGRVLSRHPDLKVIFPHFYFLSDDLDRAGALLADHPNVHLDLAPGIELYYNLSRDPARTREFFLKHSARILFGTDMGLLPELGAGAHAARLELVRRFLETDDEFRVPQQADYLLGPPEDGLIRGVNLPDETLEKICRGNFERLAGSRPRPLNLELAAGECRRIAAEVDALAGGRAADNTAAKVADLLEN